MGIPGLLDARDGLHAIIQQWHTDGVDPPVVEQQRVARLLAWNRIELQTAKRRERESRAA